jgi:hypothetical protein
MELCEFLGTGLTECIGLISLSAGVRGVRIGVVVIAAVVDDPPLALLPLPLLAVFPGVRLLPPGRLALAMGV